MGLRALLQNELSAEELALIRNHFDLIGGIALIHIPEALEHRKHLIASKLVEGHKNVKTVLRRIGNIQGDFRVASYELLIGNNAETVHRENGCSFKLNPAKVHFSWKLAAERARIASLVRDGEEILCLFAGVGPFPVVIAKQREVRIRAVEKNPIAISYFNQNLRLNGAEEKISLVERDAEAVLPGLDRTFDRIVMPSPYLKPEERFRYLDLAMPHVKREGTIHSYFFAAREEIPGLGEKLMERYPSARVLRVKKCGNYAPGVHRVAVDLQCAASCDCSRG